MDGRFRFVRVQEHCKGLYSRQRGRNWVPHGPIWGPMKGPEWTQYGPKHGDNMGPIRAHDGPKLQPKRAHYGPNTAQHGHYIQ
jgi:hypothetical protein